MIRALVAPLDGSPGVVRLLDQEDHHLTVRRAAPGDPIEVLDGRGGIGRGRLGLDGKRWTVELDRVLRIPRPVALEMVVGAGDRDRFFWLVEKATELGATAVVPLLTERARHVANRIREEHRTKLERRAWESLKQCGGAWAPEIGPPTELGPALAAARPGVRWLADSGGGEPGLVESETAATIIIGPEGGLVPDEVEACRAAGFVPVRLAPRVLRFETAALAALALIAPRRRERDD